MPSGPSLLTQQAVRLSVDQYGSDNISAFKIPKGFTKPVQHGKPLAVVSGDLREAQQKLSDKSEMTLLLGSQDVN